MFYCAIQGWANGNPDKIYRATDSNGNVCGKTNSVTQDYPYAYFYNPIQTVNNRFCVKSCPTNGAIPDCYGTLCSGLTWVNIDPLTGSLPAGNTGATGFLLYNTEGLLGRICIPETKVLENALKSAVSSISSASNTGTFGNFINDLKTVTIYLYLELDVVARCVWLCCCSFFHLDVCS